MWKKRNNQNPVLQNDSLKLSLCMIVKNEEKNLEKALSSVRDITFEQVVVDTGSVDRTVEIAEAMGAKVVHFKWINDFSAAKNFAIENATGDWIVFLDADEYFTPDDAKRLMSLLESVEANEETRDNCLAVRCKQVDVDENSKPMFTFERVRVFRNLPSIRYTGRIHEWIDVKAESIVAADDITVIHTGYTETANKETGRIERNVELLRIELAEKPNDLNIKAYLADSLRLNTDEASLNEAGALFTEVLNGGADVSSFLKMKAYAYFMNKYANDPEKLTECEELCRKALVDFPDSIDFRVFSSVVLNNKGNYAEAWELLTECEAKLSNASSEQAYFISADPTLLFKQKILAAQGLGDVANVIKYAAVILKIDKTKQEILIPYIATLLKHGATVEELLKLLDGIYDFGNPNDLLLIARASTNCGAIVLAQRVMEAAGGLMG
jgi:glycosyltransferase involved in cell wall biosynthesis